MDHRPLALYVQHRPLAQPCQQFLPIRGVEHGIERVAAVLLRMAGGHGEQVKVVIAQHRHCGIAQISHQAQGRERVGPAVYQVADKPQPVACTLEGERLEQMMQRVRASLYVADGVGCHAYSARSSLRY